MATNKTGPNGLSASNWSGPELSSADYSTLVGNGPIEAKTTSSYLYRRRLPSLCGHRFGRPPKMIQSLTSLRSADAKGPFGAADQSLRPRVEWAGWSETLVWLWPEGGANRTGPDRIGRAPTRNVALIMGTATAPSSGQKPASDHQSVGFGWNRNGRPEVEVPAPTPTPAPLDTTAGAASII